MSTILRFFRRPKAYARYWGWLACWHLEWRWVGGDWEWWWWNTMDYPEGLPGVPRHPRAFATVRWIRKWTGRIRGPYSHRSDFTDREMGLLHGGKGWSEQAFEDFLESIPEEPNGGKAL